MIEELEKNLKETVTVVENMDTEPRNVEATPMQKGFRKDSPPKEMEKDMEEKQMP